MSDTIDPRLAERRRRVLEDRARGGVRRVIWLMFIVALGGAIAWIVQSPLLSIDVITVVGSDRADIEGALADAGVAVGGPLLLAPVNDAEDAIRSDPWVADVAVDRLLPDTVEVRVIEHEPVAVVTSGNRSWTVSATAVALTAVPEPGLPVIELTVEPPELGAPFSDARVVGAAQFFEGLNRLVSQSGIVMFELEGELWVDLGAHRARLGRPIEMPQKAAALQAVLADGPPEGSVINVIAPTRPTVRVEPTSG